MKGMIVRTMAAMLLAAASAPAQDPAVDNILRSREARVEQARRQYEAAVAAADRDAEQRLAQLMNARRMSGDARGAESIRAAVEQLRAGAPAAVQSERATQAVEARFLALHRALVSGDLEGAARFADPKNLQFVSPAAVKAFLGVWSGLLRAGQVGANDVKVERVRIGVKGNEAIVESRIRVRGNWDEQKPSYWVFREGQWYLGDEKEIANFK